MRYRMGRGGRSPAAHSLFLIATPSYLQAGAPSEVAIPAGSAPSLTKIEHVTFEPPTRLLFVIVASHPPPGVLIPTRLLPVVGHQLDRKSTRLNSSHSQMP